MASTSYPRQARRKALRVPLVAVLGVLALIVWLLARNPGSPVVLQARSLPPFSAVELAGSNVVAVTVGGRQSVAVRARKDMLGQVTTRVVAGTLVIGNTPGRHNTKGPMIVLVALPRLDSVAISGSGVVGAKGASRRLNVSLGGSGDLELAQLVARQVRAVLSGSGRIDVTATDSLEASLSGSGVIQYAGNPPHVTTSVTGSGTIVPG